MDKKALISDFEDEIKIITPQDGYHYFFGYYDMRATGDGKNLRHLCHRVSFINRQPTASDECELGYLENGEFYPFAKTTAWNFQQGAMLEYHPTLENTVFYNVVKDGKFVTATHNFVSGEIRYTDRACACISPDGSYGLAVNFGRIFAFRAGYGYAGFVDENSGVCTPTDDGVFLVDMNTGESKLLISYRDIAPIAGFLPSEKILVNHITFAPNSKKFLMLIRDFREGGGWDTSMLVCDLSGDAFTVVKRSYVSHYCWINDREICAHATVVKGKQSLYIFDTETLENRELTKNYCSGELDVHCLISPNGKYIIGDGYPEDGYRPLVAIELESGKSTTLLRAFSIAPDDWDIRCDLHARFILGGSYISYDTTENGRREVAAFPSSIIKF